MERGRLAVNIHTIDPYALPGQDGWLRRFALEKTGKKSRFWTRTHRLSSTDHKVAPHVIVFDLGGVMAEISHTWEDAAKCAKVHCTNLTDGATKLTAIPAFDEYQADLISLDEYLSRLGEFVGCSAADALSLHNGILVMEYPGVMSLVDELRAKCAAVTERGAFPTPMHLTGEYLALNGHYPAIHSLEMKMASHLVGLNKPSTAIFERYCAEFGLQPSKSCSSTMRR